MKALNDSFGVGPISGVSNHGQSETKRGKFELAQKLNSDFGQ